MPDTKQGGAHAAAGRPLRASDESGASFARRHGVTPWTFWYWQRKRADADQPGAAVSLIPVRVVSEDAGEPVEIVLTTGDRVRPGAGASVELVRVAVTALRSA